MALGLERDISDVSDEDPDDALGNSVYTYETEEDEVIEDEDADYLEHLDEEEAKRADPQF